MLDELGLKPIEMPLWKRLVIGPTIAIGANDK